MRTECKNFESRTYPSGDTVRKCNLDLAPDAPWRCPENCPAYERRLADRAWAHGSLAVPPTPPEPAGLDDGAGPLGGVVFQVLVDGKEVWNSGFVRPAGTQ